jgi:hypothetical protein
MDAKGTIRRFIPLRWQRASKNEPLSMVLLLRRPHVFSGDELRLAAERAWRVSFTSNKDSSKHFVSPSGSVTFLKAGPHLLNLFFYSKPYVENPQDNITWLKKENQRRAWAEHSACVGVDYLNPETDAELGYCVLAKLVAELLDENCTSIYVPRERSLIPNNAGLYGELQNMASSRESAV